MKSLILFAMMLCAPVVHAEAVFDTARGQYGSATDSATSCAANPHRLDFMASPPHAMLTWQKPKDDGVGQPRSFERYDI